MDHSSMEKGNYVRLGIMAVLSFIAMYVLMYSMVNTFSDVIPSFNQFYMAGLMAAPMIVIEVLLMGMMYSNKKLNVLIVGTSIVLGVLFFVFIRQQTLIGDEQFLKSMIPHHSGAVLMCEKADIQDPEIKELCGTIVQGQQEEIDQMQRILNRLD
jgi:uncharacterized protein (DUF305 family)